MKNIDLILYEADMERDGATYHTITYAWQHGNQVVEAAFWLVDDTARHQAHDIISSLRHK